MSIIGIVAVDKHGAIGRGGAIPWHYSADLKFFQQQTINHACVMGAQTWRSLKRPLKERLNIVLSRHMENETPSGIVLIRDKISVLALQPYLACHLFIIGGAQIYRAFLPEIAEWIVTEVPVTVEDADTFMPEGYLEGFSPRQTLELEDNLRVTYYGRDSVVER